MNILPGNEEKYDIAHVRPLPKNPLTGKHICYLGSSVTFGSASGGESFVEYIAKRNQTTYRKEAVSGTTLVDNGDLSYIARLKRIDTEETFDLFVCQLSTNDATRGFPLEEIERAIVYIATYAHQTWNCPIVFYTNAYYEDERYASMVQKLHELRDIYPYLYVIDLYGDASFRVLTDAERALYMADKIHPTKAGYLMWWTPKMEAELFEILKAYMRR